MAIYRRGKIWWYKFRFQGQVIRESTNSPSKSFAIRAERQRRRQLEEGAAGLTRQRKPLLFKVAARQWLDQGSVRWSASNYRIETYNVGHLLPRFGKLLLTDITPADILQHQRERLAQGASPRTCNLEVAALRAILRQHRLWANLQPDVKPLKTQTEVGRALTDEEVVRLMEAVDKSRSRSLPIAVRVTLNTGLRNAELRHLRWRQVDLEKASLIVGKSKTIGGEGRVVPLNTTALAALRSWRALFPEALAQHYVFPTERYGLAGDEGQHTGKAAPYDIDPTRPIGSWKVAWQHAKQLSAIDCRWHDLRHTFVSRLAEGQASDATIMALAGHLSPRMLQRYSHVGNERKREAVHNLALG